MTTALASAPPVDRPGLPLLARVVALGHTARASYRRAQAFRALVAARRQLRSVAHPVRDRAAVLAELAGRLLVIDGVDLDVIGSRRPGRAWSWPRSRSRATCCRSWPPCRRRR